MTAQYTQPTSERRQELLKIAGESERLVKDEERKKITTLSRSEAWKKESEGAYSNRIRLSQNSVAWLLSDLLSFIYQQVPTNKKTD